MKYVYLKCAALLFYIVATFAAGSCSTSETRQPNVILIMADDMGFECLSTYGSQSYQTPHLDKMAEKGIRFENCIANPLCTPSRVKIMTGKYNYRNYEYFGYLNPDQYTFGNMFHDAGYATCIVGKWQLNGLSFKLPGYQDLSRPFSFGFDEYCLWQVTKPKKEGERFANPLIAENGLELPRDPDAYGPDIFADYACDFIDQNADSSFFIYYPMVLVHDPFVPTPDSESWSDPEKRYKNDTAYFKDMVAYTDKIVGRILDKLEEHGIADNTLVIFTGDNGTGRPIVSRLPERELAGGKGKTIDAGVHVPLIMQWPAQITEGRVDKSIVDFSDFFATFNDLLSAEKENDGQSFLALLKGDEYSPREYAFVHYDPRWGKFVNDYRNMFVQNANYKLYQDGNMYCLKKDFEEAHPLPMNSETIDNDLSKTRTEMQEILDLGPLWKDADY